MGKELLDNIPSKVGNLLREVELGKIDIHQGLRSGVQGVAGSNLAHPIRKDEDRTSVLTFLCLVRSSDCPLF